jgi:hypothetical protein
MINYTALQKSAKTNLVSNGAVSLIVRLLNNATISTVGIFINGEAKNIDNRQNPTWTTGETDRMVIVPGIDFYTATTNTTTTPQVGGTVEWTINAVLYKKVINNVAMEMPIPNTPLIFILGID